MDLGLQLSPKTQWDGTKNDFRTLLQASCNFDWRSKISSSLQQPQLPHRFFFWFICHFNQVFKRATVLSSLLPDIIWPTRLDWGYTWSASHSISLPLMQCVSVTDDRVIPCLCTKPENPKRNFARNKFTTCHKQHTQRFLCFQTQLVWWHSSKKRSFTGWFWPSPSFETSTDIGRKSTGLTSLQKGGASLLQNIYFISSKSQGFCNMWLQPLKSLWETFHHSFFPSQTALIEAPVQISPHFKGLKFQRRWALPCQFIPRLFFLLPGGDDASILKGDINKPKRLFLSQFHGSTAHQTPEKEKPTYFELPVQLQALSTEVCFCDPACESQKQEDRNISMTWHGDRQSDTAQRQAGLKGAG